MAPNSSLLARLNKTNMYINLKPQASELLELLSLLSLVTPAFLTKTSGSFLGSLWADTRWCGSRAPLSSGTAPWKGSLCVSLI